MTYNVFSGTLNHTHSIFTLLGSLSCYLGHDVLVVVVAQRAAEFVVVHVRLALSFAPASRHLVRINQLELAVRALPADAVHVAAVRQQLEQKLPQLYLTAACM